MSRFFGFSVWTTKPFDLSFQFSSYMYSILLNVQEIMNYSSLYD